MGVVHKRLKDVATRSVLTIVKASKCACDRSSALVPVEGAYSSLRTPWIWEGKRTEEGRGGKGLAMGSGARRKRQRGGEGRGEEVKKGWKGRSNVKPLPNKKSGYTALSKT